jgi:hypothetical protein
MNTFRYIPASLALLATALVAPVAAQQSTGFVEGPSIEVYRAADEDGARALTEIRRAVRQSLRELQPPQHLLQSLLDTTEQDAMHVATRARSDGL